MEVWKMMEPDEAPGTEATSQPGSKLPRHLMGWGTPFSDRLTSSYKNTSDYNLISVNITSKNGGCLVHIQPFHVYSLFEFSSLVPLRNDTSPCLDKPSTSGKQGAARDLSLPRLKQIDAWPTPHEGWSLPLYGWMGGSTVWVIEHPEIVVDDMMTSSQIPRCPMKYP